MAQWFDSNGRPYKRLDGGLGCPRSKVCYFAHPSDGEYWRDARLSGWRAAVDAVVGTAPHGVRN